MREKKIKVTEGKVGENNAVITCVVDIENNCTVGTEGYTKSMLIGLISIISSISIRSGMSISEILECVTENIEECEMVSENSSNEEKGAGIH